VRVEGQEDGFEAGLGFPVGDAGEVDAGDDGEEAEDEELEVRDAGLERVVEPAAEVVVAGAGVGLAEEGGDVGVEVGAGEESGGGELGERGDDGGEGFHGGLHF